MLLATGLPLLYAGLLLLAAALGANFDEGPPAGALMWTSALAGGARAVAGARAQQRHLAAVRGDPGRRRAARRLGVGLRAARPRAFRWLLLLYAFALLLSSLALREPARRHAEVLIDAGGLAIVAIGVAAIVADVPLPGFWELVLLAAGFGLVAFGALDRSPGPAYLGVVNLVLFILSAAAGDDSTLYGWPLFLLVAGIAMLAAGLRPRRPLPPEPSPYRAGEAPLAARADDGEIVVRVRDDT